MKAEIIIIGDEVLIGDTLDTNSNWMVSQLDQIGIPTRRITTIGDEESGIFEALKLALQNADLVLITGGLGPTHDDITKQTLARFFKDDLVEHPQVMSDLKTLLEKFGRDVGTLNKLQAQVPSRCEIIRNERGTAPGMIFRENNQMVVSMPGVPREMRGMMTKTVIPMLADRPESVRRLHRYIRIFGIAEATLAENLAITIQEMPKYIRMAFLPTPGHVRIRLSATSGDALDMEEQLKEWTERLIQEIGPNVYGGEHDSLELKVGQMLTKGKWTVTTAESCTGGNLAGKITSVSGSSAYFLGSIVSYSNEIKIKNLGVSPEDLKSVGAVSEEVVSAMAEGVRNRFQSDYALATSGIAGPDGGTVDKPVGTIWVALAGPDGVRTKRLQLGFDRKINISLTVDHALNMLRKELLERFDRK